jgi:hypothetical protein
MQNEITDLNQPQGGSAGGGDSYLAPGDLPTAGPQPDPFNGYEDYYAFDEREKWYFPDGKQWIEFKKLSEGDRAKYLKDTRSDVRLNQKTNEAVIPFDQSGDRKSLLLHSITDWHMVSFVGEGASRRVMPLPFQPGGHKGGPVAQWIDRANPAILGQLEKAIRKANPWLLNEMSAEQIRKEIADLEELLVAAQEREESEGNFASK